MAWLSLRDSIFLYFRRLGIFFAANFLWIVCSLPLITLPAATGALYYLVHRVISEEYDPEPQIASIRDFWQGFRLYWQQSTLVLLANFALFTILSITAIFYWRNPVEWLNWLLGPLLLVFLAFLAMNVYLLPLRQIYRGDSIRAIFRRAARLVLTYPMDSLLLLVWSILIVIFCSVLAGPVFFLLFSFLAVIQSFALRKIRVQQGEIIDRIDED